MLPDTCYATSAVERNIVTEIINTFKKETDNWFNVARNAATSLFYLCISLEIVYLGIKSVLSQDEMKDILKSFVFSLLAASFFMAVINNYQEWTGMIIGGLESFGGDMANIKGKSDNPFQLGLDIITIINDQVSDLGWEEMGIIIAMYLASFILIICFSLITARIIVIKCEAIVATIAALIIIPFGATSFFREYAINTMRYVVAVAFKLFTMQLIIGVGFGFLAEIGTGFKAEMSDVGILIGFSIVLLTISNTIPETVASLINNASGGSGAGIMSSVRTVSSVVTAAASLGAGAAKGGVGLAKGLSAAKGIAQAEGASGFAGVAKGMGKAMMDARKQGQQNQNQNSMRSIMENRMAEINALRNGG